LPAKIRCDTRNESASAPPNESGPRARSAFRRGRLNTGDYEQRVTAAYEAATLTRLRPLVEDLPEPRPAFLSPPVTMPPVGYPIYPAPPVGIRAGVLWPTIDRVVLLLAGGTDPNGRRSRD
jgi:hypothetical protein